MSYLDKPPLDENLLAHFGIKGMKWGVRKERTYSTEERTIDKGYALQNVSASGAVKIGDRRVFTSHGTKDNLAYRGTYARSLKVMSDNADTYTNTLVTTKKLKVASEKAAFDEFRKMYDKDPAGVTRSIAQSYEALNRAFLGLTDTADTKLIDAKFKSYSKKGDAWINKQGYDLFVTAAGTDMLPRDVANSYYSNVARRGYDAMVDHTDKIAKMADDPIVILKPKGAVKVTDTVPLNMGDIKLARQQYKEVRREEKRGGG